MQDNGAVPELPAGFKSTRDPLRYLGGKLDCLRMMQLPQSIHVGPRRLNLSARPNFVSTLSHSEHFFKFRVGASLVCFLVDRGSLVAGLYRSRRQDNIT